MKLALLPALFGLALSASPATGTKEVAAPRCTLLVDTGAREERALGGDALREALARASGCEVASGRRAPTVLRLRLVGGRARLELRVQGRAALVRVVALDADPEERTEAIVIVATHMLRNEADELLGLLGRPSGAGDTSTGDTSTRTGDTSTSDATQPETETSAAAEVTAPDAPTRESEATAESEAATESEATTEPESEATEGRAAGAPSVIVEETPLPEDAPHPRGPPVVRLGLTSLVSSVPSGTGAEVTVIGGLEVAATPTPWLAFGARDLLGGVPLGATSGWSFGGGLFAELSLRVLSWLALEGQLGADVRAIGLGDRQSAGVAPFVVVGARAHLAPELSLALESGLHVVASDVWSSALHLVPRGAAMWSGGLALGVHL